MGGLNSKLSNDRSTTTPLKKPNELYSDDDPRSPNIFRTPLTKKTTPLTAASNDICPSNLLKSKLQDAIDSINLNDPRSPSTFFVRTPICLKNPLIKINDKVEDAKMEYNQLVDNADNELSTNNVNDCSDNEQGDDGECDVSAVTEISTIDPRSPSLHIDRTPFFFANKITEKVELITIDEPITTTTTTTDPIIADEEDDANIQQISKIIKTIIFEDNENNYCTPPKKICEKKAIKMDASENHQSSQQQQQRTPLSCLGNRKGKFKNNKIDDHNSSSWKSFNGFAKENNVFTSSRAEFLDKNIMTSIDYAADGGNGDINKEKLF